VFYSSSTESREYITHCFFIGLLHRPTTKHNNAYSLQLLGPAEGHVPYYHFLYDIKHALTCVYLDYCKYCNLRTRNLSPTQHTVLQWQFVTYTRW